MDGKTHELDAPARGRRTHPAARLGRDAADHLERDQLRGLQRAAGLVDFERIDLGLPTMKAAKGKRGR